MRTDELGLGFLVLRLSVGVFQLVFGGWIVFSPTQELVTFSRGSEDRPVKWFDRESRLSETGEFGN